MYCHMEMYIYVCLDCVNMPRESPKLFQRATSADNFTLKTWNTFPLNSILDISGKGTNWE